MKNIIVITGASSGMGREFAKQIDKKEKVDEIWVIAREKEKLEELGGILETPIRILTLDLTKIEDIQKYKEEVEREKPNIKILVNCAGYGKFEHDENIPTETKLNMIDLNVKAIVLLTDYSLPYMSEGSKIMNIASTAAFQPVPYINVYAATKSFVLSYSRALNVELKYRKIHVLAVCPFWTNTAFFDRAKAKDKKEVVIKYTAMYEPEKVMAKAIKDLYNNKKDVSTYGFINNLQIYATKFCGHQFVMKIWMKQQKLNGTREIRR